MESKASTNINPMEREPSIRYADDMVIILQPEDDATEILERVNQFLANRGMKVRRRRKDNRRQMGLTSLAGISSADNGKFRSTLSG